VLELLRQKLTNDQIAERLGISPDGAKYHVSQILSKLDVDSREEAALWKPQEARLWWRILAPIPFAAKAVGVVVIATTVAGLGVLTWAVVNSAAEDSQLASADLKPPVAAPALTREQILIRAGQMPPVETITDVTAQPSTAGDVRTFLEGLPADDRTEMFESEPDATTWLVTTRGVLSQYMVLGLFDIFSNDFEFPDPAEIGDVTYTCRDIYMAFVENSESSALVVGPPLPDPHCPTSESLSEDHLLMSAASASPHIVDGTARDVAVHQTTVGAVEELASLIPQGFEEIYDDPALVLTLDAEFHRYDIYHPIPEYDLGSPLFEGTDPSQDRVCGLARILISGAAVRRFIDERPCP